MIPLQESYWDFVVGNLTEGIGNWAWLFVGFFAVVVIAMAVIWITDSNKKKK